MQRSSRNLKKEIIKRGDARDLERPFMKIIKKYAKDLQ